MIRAYFFRPRCNNHAFINKFFIKSHIKIFIYLPVIHKSQIAMLLHITWAHAVDSIYRTTLKLVEVACDYFRSSLHIRNKYCDLVLVAEFSEALPDTMANFEVPIWTILIAEFSDDAVEVKDEQVLVLKSLPSFKQESLGDKCGFWRPCWQMLLSQSFLIKLYLSPCQFHLLILVHLALTCLFLNDAPLLLRSVLTARDDLFGGGVVGTRVKLRVLDGLSRHKLGLLNVDSGQWWRHRARVVRRITCRMISLELVRRYQKSIHEALIASKTTFDVNTLTIEIGLLLRENHVLIITSCEC